MEVFERFGKFTLVERLGEGGMAEVYLALSPAVDGLYKLVTIKKVLPQLTGNEDFVELFKREARVVLNLNHANVLSIYDFGFKQGQYYLVMDYVQGCTLREILNKLKQQNTRLTIEQIVYIVREIANGLEHAHNCLEVTTGRKLNITHQDIKPENIMISYEGAIKVIDFGIAKADFTSLLEPLGSSSQAAAPTPIRGTAAYMSPEHIMGEPVDCRSDIFSLGVIFWELITDQKLFTGAEESDILVSVIKTAMPSVSKYNSAADDDLNRIVDKALKKEPHERYQSAQALFHDLNKYLNAVNPNFTTHQFNAFIRELTATESQQSRAKIIDYTTRVNNELGDAINPENAEPDNEGDFSENPGFNFFANSEITGMVSETKTSEIDFTTATFLPPTVAPEKKKPIPAPNIPKPPAVERAPEKLVIEKYGVIGLFVLPVVLFLGLIFYRQSNTKKQLNALKKIEGRTEAIVATPPPSKKVLKIAYLNITTHEKNENITLYIDGQKIFDKPPVAMLPVTAGRNFVLSALNAKTNQTVKFSLNLSEGEQKSIDLFP